ETAPPILRELGIPATFFIPSQGILGRREFWWDVLASIFFGPSVIPNELVIEAEGETLKLPSATPRERQQAHHDLYHRIRRARQEERDRLLQKVSEWAGASSREAEARPMNRAEVEELARRTGHSIGGHGTHHLSLSEHSEEVVRREVEENRTLLELSIGRVVTTFAYPFGDHDDRAVQVAADAGYRAAVTCVEDLVRPLSDPLRLPRLALGSS